MVVNQSWTIIIFAYNEVTAIRKVVTDVINIMEEITPNSYEVVIVNDGSTDGTSLIIEEIQKKHTEIIVVTHPENLGIGKALLSGYSHAKNENICAIPADGQFDVREIVPFAVISPKTIISFYRTVKTRYTLFRKFLSFGNRFINSYLLGIKIKDVNWVKIYKKEFFDEITPVLSSSLVESEICAKMIRNHYKIIEVPSKYNPRNGGKSKGASARTVFTALAEITKLYFALRK
jgi:glycosyltransferase involved in cell wall biosynthesis